jgi:hypothetical protein
MNIISSYGRENDILYNLICKRKLSWWGADESDETIGTPRQRP